MVANPGALLRSRISGSELIVAPGVFDGVSANLVKSMGFSAAYLTGAGVAAFGYGLPDIGLVTGSEMADRAGMLVDVLGGIPLIADADTGYGAPLNVIRTVRTYERAGVAAIQIEDQAFPKRCGHLPDKELVSEGEFIAKLSAALDARSDALIIARTDARAVMGLSAAIDRANAYAEAGADVIFVEAPQSEEEIKRIAADVRAPLLINMVPGGLTPRLSRQRLQDLGFAISIHPGELFQPVVAAMIASLRELGGTPPAVTSAGIASFFDVVGLREWSALGERRS